MEPHNVNCPIKEIGHFYVFGSETDKSVMAQIKQGQYEPHIQTLFNKLIKPSMIVADVGANYGQHTVLLSKLVGETGRVVAIEAGKENANHLRQTLLYNSCDNVSVVECGVWSRETELEFNHTDDGAGWSFFTTENFVANGRKKTTVKVSTLNKLIECDIDFMKIDIGGSELFALRGASKILAKNVPILIELNAYTSKKFMNIHIMDVVRYIAEHNYRYIYIFNCNRWTLVPASMLEKSFNSGAVIIDALFTNKLL